MAVSVALSDAISETRNAARPSVASAAAATCGGDQQQCGDRKKGARKRTRHHRESVAASVFKLLFIALSLSLDVFAVSLGAGIRGVPPEKKWRIGVAFACAEIGMNLIGAALGLAAGRLLGATAGYIGFVALVVLGAYMMKESRAEPSREPIDLSKGWGLALAALSISLDSLGIGFSILYIGVPPAISLVTIGAFSIIATVAGIALGRRLGAFAQRYAGFLGGLLLTLTGLTFIALKALHLE